MFDDIKQVFHLTEGVPVWVTLIVTFLAGRFSGKTAK